MKKIPVGILGATGLVGQKMLELLEDHPWFTVTALAASDRSAGKSYAEAIHRPFSKALDPKLAQMKVAACEPGLPCRLVFSALDSNVAGGIEESFAEKGYVVISNCSNHRMEPDVPLIIPEVNSSHLELIKSQRFGKGCIITNPNCTTIGIAMALKPLADLWGVEWVNTVTLQALSGAGYPGVPSLEIMDNIIPFIAGEEHKIETEPLKILGKYHQGSIKPYPARLSAQCTRVPVTEGHVACVSVRLKEKAQKNEIISAWAEFSGDPQSLALPTAPQKPVIYFEEHTYPQPSLHRTLDKGMAVSIGRLRPCPLLDWKFVLLSHNIIRGAAGGTVLIAELMVKKGLLP